MDTLAAAENLWNQGEHDGAWLALEELPQIDPGNPAEIDLRLRGRGLESVSRCLVPNARCEECFSLD